MKKNDVFATITTDELDRVAGGQMMNPADIQEQFNQLNRKNMSAGQAAADFYRMMNK